MRWQKLGHLFSVDNLHPKMVSHAANPLALHLDGDVFRIFFSARDRQNRSSVGAVDIDIITRGVVKEHTDPVFTHGPSGSFFEYGVSIGNCYESDGKRYILFMGWQIPPGEHWRGEVGRLLVRDDLSLALDPPKAFMALDQVDPISLSYPWVLRDQQNNYRMWYGSTLRWAADNGEMIHVLKHAHSKDGELWIKDQRGIPYIIGEVQAFSRPTVLYDQAKGYRMWFSYRSGDGTPYRIGYAHSDDGEAWEIDNLSAGISTSQMGWDSQMIEYPFVFSHAGKNYMVYNGNDFGKTGFGLAVMSDE